MSAPRRYRSPCWRIGPPRAVAGCSRASTPRSPGCRGGTLPATDGPAARRRFAARADSARTALGTGAFNRVVALLDRGKRDLSPQSDDSRAQILFSTPEQADQRRHTERALAIAAGLVADALAHDDRVIGGQADSVDVLVWNAGTDSISVTGGLVPSAEWHVESDSNGEISLGPGEVHRSVATLTPDTAAIATTPYFLRHPRQGALYDWTGVAATDLGEPFGGSVPVARFGRLGPGGETSREVSYRVNDQAQGEVRRPVVVVPRVGVRLDPPTYVWSLLTPGTHRFTVTLTHGARDTTTGTVGLELPEGWPPVRPQAFRLISEDEREAFTFDVSAPRGAERGTATIHAFARDSAGREYTGGVFTVDVPAHPQPHVCGPRDGGGAARAGRAPEARAGGLCPRRLRRRARGAPAGGPAGDAARSGGAGARRPHPVHGDRHRPPGVRDRFGAGGEQRPAPLLRSRRRGAGGAIPAAPVLRGWLRPAPAHRGRASAHRPGRHAARQRGNQRAEPRPRQHRAPGGPRPRGGRDRAGEGPGSRPPGRCGGPTGFRSATGKAGSRSAVSTSRGPGTRPTSRSSRRTTKARPSCGEDCSSRPVGRGTYVYTGLSFFRQLPAGNPGALRLFVNLLALGQRPTR